MSVRPRIAVALALAGAAAAAGLVAGPLSPAAGDPIADCTPTTGVIVAVDFAAWGGAIERGCDATLTTGYDALHVAGFTTAGDIQDGPAFICRIDDDPPLAQQACLTTPPAGAYWSYWHADAGQDTWSYSAVGAADYHPPAGSVDAWTFGSTDIDGTSGQPTFSPSAVRATGTGPGPTTTTTATTPPVGTTPATTAPPTGLSATTVGTSPAPVTRSRGSSPPTTGPGHGPGPASSSTEPGVTTSTVSPGPTTASSGRAPPLPKIVDAAPARIDRAGAGSPAALLGGVALAVVLAAAAGLAVRRRRRIS